MELYDKTSYELAERLTKRYSTSFSLSSRLFDVSIRRHIYAVYGLVRIADEIVDTYVGKDQAGQLDDLERELSRAMKTQYSTNPIVHAFVRTAAAFSITSTLTKPFFESMRTDITRTTFSDAQYRRYIYGSAEVIGLMCLKVFVGGDEKQYKKLEGGARALGAAYQKVNFLRDMRADYERLGRVYFPGVSFQDFSNQDLQIVIKDISNDFRLAEATINELPATSQRAVRASYVYYYELFQKLRAASPAEITSRRLRVADWRKWLLLAKVGVGR